MFFVEKNGRSPKSLPFLALFGRGLTAVKEIIRTKRDLNFYYQNALMIILFEIGLQKVVKKPSGEIYDTAFD